MSGIELKTEVKNLEAIDDAVAAMIAAAGDLTPVMDDIGASLVVSTQYRFEIGQGPDGVDWTASKRVEALGGQTLVDKTHLFSSMTHEPASDQVAVGSNMVYAAIHNFGGKTGRNKSVDMPARPYLGIDADDETMIMEKLTAYLAEVLQ
tara:strand:- start:50330 stop:50776 length:447 start_codon:yes stop_codon:yes gene_type:complete